MQSSCCVCDEAGQVVLEWDADRLQLPASALKVATAVGLLQQHVENQVLTTRMQLSGARVRWLGDYDPELSSGDLEDLALQLLPQLSGKVELEVGVPGSEPYPPGWSWDDLSSSFAPPVAPLIFDHGLIPLKLLAGQQLQVAGPPWVPQGGLNFIPGSAEFEMLVLPGWENWVMAGQIAPGVEEAVTVPVLRPELAATRLLGEVFRRHGLQVEVVAPKSWGAPAFEVSHRSRSIQQILAQGLADSDNLVLECLYRRFGKALPECWKGANQRVVDGCGLSRYDLVSARQLMQLLQFQPQVVTLLPLAGQEGTLRKRFQGTPLQGEMHAKTGTMSGVSCLVGDFPAATGKHFRFALMLQGYVGSALPYKKAEDELILQLAQDL